VGVWCARISEKQKRKSQSDALCRRRAWSERQTQEFAGLLWPLIAIRVARQTSRRGASNRPMFHFINFVRWLNDTPISVYLREGDWPFPIIETIHILGLGFSVGTVMWLDLRLLKLTMREVPVADVIDQLEPWAMGGFAVMLVSGSLLILSEPLKCYNTIAFRIKVVLLILAALNVLYFHKRVMHNVDEWDQNMPWRAKMVGALSLVLWLGVVIAGRWTAYF